MQMRRVVVTSETYGVGAETRRIERPRRAPTTNVRATVGVDPDIEFVRTDFLPRPPTQQLSLVRRFAGREPFEELLSGRKVPIDGSVRHAGGIRHGLHAEAGHAIARDDRRERIEDRSARQLGLSLAQGSHVTNYDSVS